MRLGLCWPQAQGSWETCGSRIPAQRGRGGQGLHPLLREVLLRTFYFLEQKLCPWPAACPGLWSSAAVGPSAAPCLALPGPQRWEPFWPLLGLVFAGKPQAPLARGPAAHPEHVLASHSLEGAACVDGASVSSGDGGRPLGWPASQLQPQRQPLTRWPGRAAASPTFQSRWGACEERASLPGPRSSPGHSAPVTTLLLGSEGLTLPLPVLPGLRAAHLRAQVFLSTAACWSKVRPLPQGCPWRGTGLRTNANPGSTKAQVDPGLGPAWPEPPSASTRIQQVLSIASPSCPRCRYARCAQS